MAHNSTCRRTSALHLIDFHCFLSSSSPIGSTTDGPNQFKNTTLGALVTLNMEPMENHSNAVLSINQRENSFDQSSSIAIWSNCAITVHKDNSCSKGSKAGKFRAVSMTSEESKIRGELESEVERDLEEEIKDGICHLALRLHRLYQHQNAREEKVSQAHVVAEVQSKMKKTIFTEVNITIRMEGESKIEIHQNKKEIRRKERAQTKNGKLDVKQNRMNHSTKEFDWVRTLRSGSSSVGTQKKNETSKHGRVFRNGNDISHTAKHVIKDRKTFINTAGQGRGKVFVKDCKYLQLGWRN